MSTPADTEEVRYEIVEFYTVTRCSPTQPFSSDETNTRVLKNWRLLLFHWATHYSEYITNTIFELVL